ncbi:jg18087, partial [Pararge aegeria aegeria]
VRRVRQGDVISPKLFTAALEDVFKRLDRNELGININDEYITQLRFADDVDTLGDLNTILNNLSRVSQLVDLRSKTICMTLIFHSTL